MKSSFVGLDPKEIAVLRNGDPAVRAIHELVADGKTISFSWLRANFGRDRDIWDQLGRGTSILGSTHQLDQYLFSYGPMIARQWQTVIDGYSLSPEPIRLIDYGCGQGLAGLLQFDKFGSALSVKLAEVVLIEPSPAALIRAEAVYRAIAPAAGIRCVAKPFDDVTTEDLAANDNLASAHLFSNVLDVVGFNQYRLFSQILTPGQHTIVAVSPDRDFDGGTARIRGLKAAVEDPRLKEQLIVEESTLRTFRCGPGDKYPVVSWFAKIEVSNG